MDNDKSSQKFKTGDTVKLVSDGPAMTVKNPNYLNQWVICQWFAGKKLEEGQFSPGSLIRADINEKEK